MAAKRAASRTRTNKPPAETIECWHFLGADKRLRYGDRTLVKRGSVVRVAGTPILCSQGLHGSIRAIDALGYAPGPIVCRVNIGGMIVHAEDKLAGQWRKCLWMADATNVLHEFACLCAEDALRTAKVVDVRCWQAIETKRKWLRGEVSDEELDAAAAAAPAAWSAEWSAARAAARSAARAAQNTRLESMLFALEPTPEAASIRPKGAEA